MDPTDVSRVADQLATALEAVQAGDARTQPVSTSLPTPLVTAFRSLADAGMVASLSAAATEALTRFGHNLLLRLALEEIYAEQPDARPTDQQVHEAAERLGVTLPESRSDRVA